MIGRVKITVQTRRGARAGWPMGKVKAGTLVEWTESEFGWLRIGNRWIPAWAVQVVSESPDVLSPPICDGTLKMVRWHSEMPVDEQNRGSFGIVRVYAGPKADKAHSVFPSAAFINSVRFINTARAFSWLYEHNDNRFFGANYDDGSGYRIPSQGVFMGNMVRVLEVRGNFSRLYGLIGPIPAGVTFVTHPELIHFCWCVDKAGRTIMPPGGSAYHPVVNPTGMKGAGAQTEIWIENKWLKDVDA